MKQKILAIGAALLLALGTAACGTTGPDSNQPVLPQSSIPSAPDGEGEEPSEVRQVSVLRAVQIVLDKYRSGEYPQEYLLEADGLHFPDSFPADSMLPETVSWEELTVKFVENDLDNAYFSNSMTVELPLENEYLLSLWGGEETDGSWTVMGGRVQDLRETQQFGRMETEFGTFSEISADRLRLFSQLENLAFPGLPDENSGVLSVDLVHSWVVLHLNFPNGDAFSATTYRYPPVVSTSIAVELDENELNNQLVNCGVLLRNIISAESLTPAELDLLTQSVNEVLTGYREGRYPLPISYGTEYYLNDEFPNDIAIPDEVVNLQLSPAGEDGPVSHIVRLSLDGGYQAVFYYSLNIGNAEERTFTLRDLRFEDADGVLIPHPAP